MPRTKVSFQGERGAFSEEACRHFLGDKVSFLPKGSFEEVFQSLQSGEADCAVVPIENTLAGSVHENYDHLLNYKLPIVAEANVRIIHNLIGAARCDGLETQEGDLASSRLAPVP